jgi:SAM-dependent methyltransferase
MGFLPCDLEENGDSPTSRVEWEEVSCPLCQGRRWKTLVEGADPSPGGGKHGLWFAVVKCLDCDLCFTNPRPSPRTIGAFYPTDYRPYRKSVGRRQTLWRRLRKSPVPTKGINWHGQGRLLDFGCGSGSFLARMHQAGWRVTGVDCSAETVATIRQTLGVPVLEGTLPHPELQERSFDVLTMWHSLEHVHQPLEVLRAAYRLLVPGGKLVVELPNIDSLPFRWFGSQWFGLELPRHLTHFNPWTLRRMLERAGFDPGPVNMVRHANWLRTSARRARQRGRPSVVARLLTYWPVASVTSWYSYLTRQSDSIRVTAVKA